MNEFNDFIDFMEVIDVPLIGSMFIWENNEGSSISRLNRFLLSESLVDNWKIVGKIVEEKDILEHAPIWTKANNVE